MRFPPIMRNLKRGPQVVLPKDFGMVAAFTGIGKKSVVVDAGTGSGFLAIALGNIAKNVVTYERREEFAKLAERNIKASGLRNVKIKRKDIFKGISERDLDLVTLDFADSEKVVKHAKKALKEGGYVVGFLPNMEQVRDFVRELEKNKFSEVFTMECITREILVRETGMRPENMGLMHTVYLTFGRK
ncbi:MAG: methyltransferase domain-containing protein [Candidatus Micrarchaeota archaeon]|nr:methyltransferase domain-containing protein [Candidatus Micrarchaeota archaeon]